MNGRLLEEGIKGAINDKGFRISVAIDLPTHSIQINGDAIHSAASLIKIPILLAGFRQMEEGKFSLNEKVMIPKEEHVGGAGVLSALSDNISLTIEDLLTLMIIVSDNTATNLIIDRLGSNSIHSFCGSLKLKHTKLNRKLMDNKAMEQGINNFTSALDIITCLKAMDKSPQFSQKSREKMLGILHHQQFNNKLPSKMDGNRVYIANKTGELPGVEHDCAIVRYKDKTGLHCRINRGS